MSKIPVSLVWGPLKLLHPKGLLIFSRLLLTGGWQDYECLRYESRFAISFTVVPQNPYIVQISKIHCRFLIKIFQGCIFPLRREHICMAGCKFLAHCSTCDLQENVLIEFKIIFF